MNNVVFQEFQFFINTVATDLGENEKLKIISISSKLINSVNYIELTKQELDKIVNTPDFNFMTDFAVLIKCLIDLNKHIDFYKEITIERLKYLYYPVIYAYLYKNNVDLLNKINITDFRMLYINTIDLVLIPIQAVKIVKESCTNCMSRKIKWLKWLENKKKI